jgi:hypothetical protein
MIELYPHVIKLAIFKKDSEALDFTEEMFSKKLTLVQLLVEVKKIFNVSDKEARLWAAHCGSPYRLYSPGEVIQDLQTLITRPVGQQIILEVKNESGKWPISYKHTESEFKSSYSSGTSLSSRESTSYEIGDNRGGEKGKNLFTQFHRCCWFVKFRKYLFYEFCSPMFDKSSTNQRLLFKSRME